jgi:hypothetical protein
VATKSRGFNVPEGGDSNDVPGDLVRLTDSIIPAMTTAQIDALSWTDKPAGWIAYDTTKLRAVISTGAAMVNVIDARGGNLGSLNIVASGAMGSTGLIELLSSGTTLTVRAGTTALSIAKDGAATLSRATVAGDTDLTLVTKGYVDDVADDVAALGTWQAFTPTLTQGVTVTYTGTCKYARIGGTVFASYEMDATSTGTANVAIQVTLPVSGVANVGGGSFRGLVGLNPFAGYVGLSSSQAFFRIGRSSFSPELGTNGVSDQLISGNRLVATITYEAA